MGTLIVGSGAASLRGAGFVYSSSWAGAGGRSSSSGPSPPPVQAAGLLRAKGKLTATVRNAMQGSATFTPTTPISSPNPHGSDSSWDVSGTPIVWDTGTQSDCGGFTDATGPTLVPALSVIWGLQVSFGVTLVAGSANYDVVFVGNDAGVVALKSPSGAVPITGPTDSFGGTGDTWGANLTPAQFNSRTALAAVAAGVDGSGQDVEMSAVLVTIYYLF